MGFTATSDRKSSGGSRPIIRLVAQKDAIKNNPRPSPRIRMPVLVCANPNAVQTRTTAGNTIGQ